MVLHYVTKFIDDSKRIFTISKKPAWDEFKIMAKVTGIGILIIGIIGFFVSLIFALIKV